MKLVALKKFETINDKTINRPRKEGEIFEVDEARAKLLISNAVAKIYEEPEQEVKEEPKEPKKAVKKAKKK